MRLNRALRIVCALLALAATPTFAQQYTVKKIVFEGTLPYSQAAMALASGIKPGDVITQDTMQQAAQKLSDTGAFDDLQISLDGSVKAITVIFKAKPISPDLMLSPTFENLIWFTPAELEAGLRARVPLFGPSLPEPGNLQDAVQSALEDMLKQKGIAATLKKHEVVEPTSERPVRYVAYSISRPAIVVHELHLTGVSPELAPAVQASETKIVGRPFNDGGARFNTTDQLLSPYYSLGYINARLADHAVTIVSSTPDRVEVDLAATIDSGSIFHLGDITWAGSPQISSADFATASPLHSGDLAKAATLARAANLLAIPYRTQGYMDIVVTPQPTFDNASGRVSYTFTVSPGEVYHTRTITPLNLTPEQQSDFDRNWTLKTGDMFNTNYIINFLKQNSALVSFKGCSASYKATRYPETHLVDADVSFFCGKTITVH